MGTANLIRRGRDVRNVAGEISDSAQIGTTLDIGPDIRPPTAMTDKGYHSQTNWDAARARDIAPVIPRRENP
jgi:hypothetical protein